MRARADGGEPQVLLDAPGGLVSYRYPQFLPGGNRLLLIRSGDAIMAVPFDGDAEQPVGQPYELFDTDMRLLPGWAGATNLDVGADGRLLMLLADEPTTTTGLRAVVNLCRELTERVVVNGGR